MPGQSLQKRELRGEKQVARRVKSEKIQYDLREQAVEHAECQQAAFNATCRSNQPYSRNPLNPLVRIEEPFVFIERIAVGHPGDIVADDPLPAVLSVLGLVAGRQ